MLGPLGLGAVARDLPWISPISITDFEQITHLAEFGVAFLLFMIALELSWPPEAHAQTRLWLRGIAGSRNGCRAARRARANHSRTLESGDL
ncbi:hypothetical protein [Sinorhizobium kostiense]|uniref:hypothetical protein n=1 Tax=Sinorhizobium kostiense TaxID=76747 RepID=UPI0038B569B2